MPEQSPDAASGGDELDFRPLSTQPKTRTLAPQARVATIDKSRENLLRHADGLNNLLFERREKARQPAESSPASRLMRALRSESQPGAP